MLIFTYQNDKLKSQMEGFAADFNSSIVLSYDRAKDGSSEALFTRLSDVWPRFSRIVHVPREQLDGDYVKIVIEKDFTMVHDIIAYSFDAMPKACRVTLNPNVIQVTFIYLGAERAMPNYNVMGLAKASLEANTHYIANAMGPQDVWVNVISAGSIRMLAASGIKNFKRCCPIANQDRQSTAG